LALVASKLGAENTIILNVDKILDWVKYICVLSVSNRTLAAAIMSEIEMEARTKLCQVTKMRLSSSEWELIDLGDIIIHVMNEEQRKFYDLESFYSLSDEVIIEEYLH
jgi:ribosome-associated protein